MWLVTNTALFTRTMYVVRMRYASKQFLITKEMNKMSQCGTSEVSGHSCRHSASVTPRIGLATAPYAQTTRSFASQIASAMAALSTCSLTGTRAKLQRWYNACRRLSPFPCYGSDCCFKVWLLECPSSCSKGLQNVPYWLFP